MNTNNLNTAALESELKDSELDAVCGGRLVVFVSPPESMQELYQDWADMGKWLKAKYNR